MIPMRPKLHMRKGWIKEGWALAKQDPSRHDFTGFGQLTRERDEGITLPAAESVAPDQDHP